MTERLKWTISILYFALYLWAMWALRNAPIDW